MTTFTHHIRILCATLMLVVGLSACGSSGGGGAAASSDIPLPVSTQPAPTPPTGGDEYGSGPDPTPVPTGNPTSNNLIDTAKTAGTLSEEESLIYKMYAEFADPALPVQYQGDNTGLIEGDAQQQVVAYIDRVGLANVPAATLDVLYPFFVPAYYEGSWWHKQHPSAKMATSKVSSNVKAASPNCKPWSPNSLCSFLTDWKKVEGTHVVVWYEAANESLDLVSANILVQEYDNKIWPSLTALMGRTPISDAGTGLVSTETDGRLDVLLVDMPGNSQGRTITSSTSCKATPSHTYLSRTLPIRGLLAQAAHEFMHSIQFSYDSKVCTQKYYTTLEATAAWATNYVYPKNNWEHSYAQHYLKNSVVGKAYDDESTPPLFRYGAYLLPLFLQTRFDATIVKDIWENTITYSQELYAINAALVGRGSSFEKEWPKFVAANWNRDTIDNYIKFDGLTVIPDVERSEIFSVSGGPAAVQHPVSLPHASSAYYRVGIGSGARSLMFMNGWSFKVNSEDISGGWGKSVTYTGLNALERQGASMQVFLKINGVWQSAPLNLTNIPWLTACHDDPAGKIEDIVFMYSNAEISQAAPNYTALAARGPLNPGMLATNIGCRNWSGSINMTMALPGGAETLTISNIVLKNAMPQASAVPSPGGEPTTYPLPVAGENTISPGFGYVYSIESGDAAWTYNNHTNDGTTICDYTGSKSFSIASPTPAHTLSNWTPNGTASYGTFLTGFVGLKVLTLTYDWHCDSTTTHTSGTEITSNSLDVTTLINDSAVRISTSGLSLSGTGAQTGTGAPDVSGTWSFTGATN